MQYNVEGGETDPIIQNLVVVNKGRTLYSEPMRHTTREYVCCVCGHIQ